MTATARAHPNIALVKYWGKRDRSLNLPAVSSLSLTLDQYHTTTTVTWDTSHDHVELNGHLVTERPLQRVLAFMDLVWGANRPPVTVVSQNNFPTAAGLASSSSGFAALALAATTAKGVKLSTRELSILARQGSGSACRSLWGGWVQWQRGQRVDGTDSHGAPLAGPNHWDVRMIVAMISSGPKSIGSTEAMIVTEQSSALYPGWIAASETDLQVARQAVMERNIHQLGRTMEASTLRMHATMMSAIPAIRYWTPGSVAVMDTVESMRKEGLSAYFTMDAGPNVKVLCRADEAEQVAQRLATHCERVEILGAGPDAYLC